jgi:DNA-binding MarR family transcriptional regulator
MPGIPPLFDRETLVHYNSLSSLIAQLEEKGYVTRTRSHRDNRVVIVELTPVGQEIAENTPLGGLPLLRRRLARLSQERLSEMNDVLDEITHLTEVVGSE